MNVIDIDHNSFAVDIMMFFCRFTSFVYDGFEIIIGEFFFKSLENIESEKTEPAFVQHEIMGIFWVLS